MALVLADRVLETCTSPGTGAVSLLGAVTGYQTFSTAVGNSNTCFYTIADQSGANWEVGIGTYASSGNTLTRTTPLSGSATTPVNFSSGTQNVFLTYPAERAVYLDANSNVGPLGTITSVKEVETAPSISSGTLTLNCALGNVFAVSLNASITTLTFTNVPSSGTAYALTLSLTATGSAYTITWGSSVLWPSGTAPTLTSTNAKTDTFVLYTYNGGTTWYAFIVGQNS